MIKMKATLMHGKHEGEGSYEFEIDEALLHDTPVRIMRKFMEHLDATARLGHIDYEINAAMKNRRENITTVIGELALSSENRQPFMCMIAPA